MADKDKSGPTTGDSRPTAPATANPWAKRAPGAGNAGTAVQTPGTGTTAPAAGASAADVAQFVDRVRTLAPVTAGQGRLIFAMDATMSRQATWDLALGLQGDMFAEVKRIGGLAVQLVYFRGYDECRASRWVADPEALARLMTTVECRGGNTQIGRVLVHACSEAQKSRVHALVYVGDCMEEGVDALCAKAGELGVMGLPVFLFQEGSDAAAESAFREIARLTGGAWCRFDQGSAGQLRELLTAVAAYAAGGTKALQQLAAANTGRGARLLIAQMKRTDAGERPA